MPDPKLVVLVGTEAISGGIFAGSQALNRSFLDRHPADLYVPGNPPINVHQQHSGTDPQQVYALMIDQ